LIKVFTDMASTEWRLTACMYIYPNRFPTISTSSWTFYH